jgi:tetratricopeptide (TPR) repeat protein
MKLRLNNLTVFIGLTIIAFIVYGPCLHASFLLYDDPEYITENYFLKDFSLRGIINLFTKQVYDLYIPLTWLSYWIELHVFKFAAQGMHFINILLHIVNAWLVFKLFIRPCNKPLPAVLIAALFLVHPQHVESVAWIAERKDMLYTLFFLQALIFYVDFKSNPSKKLYFLSMLFFILSCLSKPMAVSFPLLIVIIDYFLYNEKKISFHVNKIPFIMISVIFSFIAILFINVSALQNQTGNYSLVNKMVLTFYELGFYVFKLILPLNLSVIYEAPSQTNPILPIQTYLLALLFIAIVLYVLLKGNKYLKAALFCYVVILLPVLQLIPNASTLFADRYSYMSSIIPFALLCFLAEENAFLKKSANVILVPLVFILGLLTYNRCTLWKNDELLFTDVLTKNKNSYGAYANRGMYYLKKGNIPSAIYDLKQASDLKPTSPIVLTNYAWALAVSSQTDSALAVLLRSVQIEPAYFKTWNNLGIVLGMKGKYRLSLRCLLFAQKLNALNAELYYNMAITYANLRESSLSISCYQKAAKMGLIQAQQFLSANNMHW